MNQSIDLNNNIGSAVAVGKFDGLHLGHQLLLRRIASERANGLVPAVLAIEDPNRSEGILLPSETRSILKSFGISRYVRLPLTEKLRSLEPEVFIQNVLFEQYRAKMIVAGTDFCFGKDRKGSVSTIRALAPAYGYEPVIFEKLTVSGSPVSSARIRALIAEGHVKEAEELLGRPYFITGTVSHGRALGRTLGFPTINLAFPSGKVRPKFGVYRVLVKIGRQTFPGVANVGTKPTVSDNASCTAEVHLLQASGDYYGKTVRILFSEFMRPERRFDALGDLRQQVLEDIRIASAAFGV